MIAPASGSPITKAQSAASGSFAFTLGQTPSPGSVVFFHVIGASGTTQPILTKDANVSLVDFLTNIGTGQYSDQICYYVAGSSPLSTFTFTSNQSDTVWTIESIEFTGVNTTVPVDKHTRADLSTPGSLGPLTPTNLNELMLAFSCNKEGVTVTFSNNRSISAVTGTDYNGPTTSGPSPNGALTGNYYYGVYGGTSPVTVSTLGSTFATWDFGEAFLLINPAVLVAPASSGFHPGRGPTNARFYRDTRADNYAVGPVCVTLTAGANAEIPTIPNAGAAGVVQETDTKSRIGVAYVYDIATSPNQTAAAVVSLSGQSPAQAIVSLPGTPPSTGTPLASVVIGELARQQVGGFSEILGRPVLTVGGQASVSGPSAQNRAAAAQIALTMSRSGSAYTLGVVIPYATAIAQIASNDSINAQGMASVSETDSLNRGAQAVTAAPVSMNRGGLASVTARGFNQTGAHAYLDLVIPGGTGVDSVVINPLYKGFADIFSAGSQLFKGTIATSTTQAISAVAFTVPNRGFVIDLYYLYDTATTTGVKLTTQYSSNGGSTYSGVATLYTQVGSMSENRQRIVVYYEDPLVTNVKFAIQNLNGSHAVKLAILEATVF